MHRRLVAAFCLGIPWACHAPLPNCEVPAPSTIVDPSEREILAADVILLLTSPRGEHRQGGVIDHHDLWLHGDTLEVLAADEASQRDHLQGQAILIARGDHRDTWLCEVLRRDLEHERGAQVLVMKRRLLHHDDGRGGLVLYEYTRLPSSAADTVRRLRPQAAR